MFGWRKRNDGFEWHRYVRTTIKLRREARREKAEEIKRQAAQGARVAGVVAGEAARAGARKLGAGSRLAAMFAGSALGLAATAVARGLGRLSGNVVLAGGWLTRLARTLPQRFRHLAPRQRLAVGVGGGMLGVAAVSALAGLAGLRVDGVSRLPSLPFAAAPRIEGRASVLGTDLIRVGTQVIRLAAIEAPEREQRCERAGNKRWRCGEAARAALARLVSGRKVHCDTSGRDPAGHALGTCFVGETLINARLVEAGHVFAESGLLSRYGTQEAAARKAKLGLWAGEAERPAAYRARMWEEARRRAPDGCPIKGQVSGAGRTYVLPWSPDYARVRVNTARGGRWFCSEADALAAGWTVAGRT